MYKSYIQRPFFYVLWLLTSEVDASLDTALVYPSTAPCKLPIWPAASRHTFVYVFMCRYTFVYVFVCVCICTCVCVCIHLCMCSCVYTFVYVFVCVCICVCVHACVFICVSVCVWQEVSMGYLTLSLSILLFKTGLFTEPGDHQ